MSEKDNMRIKNKWFEFSIYKNKEKQKFIVQWWWNVPKIPLESIEYAKTKEQHQLVFCGKDNLYWVFCKICGDKYKFFYKTTMTIVHVGKKKYYGKEEKTI